MTPGRPSRVVAPVALGLALVLVGIRWVARPSAPRVEAAIGHSFPHLALAPLDGLPLLTDATLRAGHPTLVNLFASWCIPCRAEAGSLAALRVAGVAFVGIAVRDRPGDAATFVRVTGAHFVAAGLDPGERVQAALGTRGIPETWLVDGRGIVRAVWRGGIAPADVARIAATANSSAPTP